MALIPATGGIFKVHCVGELIWDRTLDGGFPEAKVIEQKLRDIVWPERDLDHYER